MYNILAVHSASLAHGAAHHLHGSARFFVRVPVSEEHGAQSGGVLIISLSGMQLMSGFEDWW